MRIVIHKESSLSLQNINFGWHTEFSNQKNHCVMWSPEDCTPFDLFYQFNPELFILCEDKVTRALYKCFEKNNSKILLIETKENEYSKQLLEENKAIKISYNKGGSGISFYHAAQSIYKIPQNPWFYSDVCYVGTYKYGKQKVVGWITEIYQKQDIHLKVFGVGEWPFFENVGPISEQNKMNMYANSALSLDIDGKMLVNTRVFDIIAAGGNPILEKTQENYEVFGDLVHYYSSCEELTNLINTKPSVKPELQDLLKSKHLYKHRVMEIMPKLYGW